MTVQGGNAHLAVFLQRLLELPFVEAVRVLDGSRSPADAVVEVSTPTGPVRLLVDLKRSHLRADAPTQLAHVHPSDPSHWILFAPHVGAKLGAELEAKGINFLDPSGNCHVRLGSHIARIQGRRPTPRASRVKALRAPGYQVLFALLAEPDLVHHSLRAIAKAAGTSVQAVVDTLGRLDDEGYLFSRRAGREWRERSRAPLLERWIEGYQSAVRPRITHGRFRLPVRGPEAVEHYLAAKLVDVRYGGTAGAYRLVRHYRGPSTVIHLIPSETTRVALRASPSDDGELIWLTPIGEIGERGPNGSVHPLLVYAELMSDPDPRARESAALIREGFAPWA